MRLEYDTVLKLFFLFCDYADRDIPQKAGFVWHNKSKCWVTPFAAVAAKVAQTDEEKAKCVYARKAEIKRFDRSNAKDPAGSIIFDDDVLFPFQKAGVEILHETPFALLADEMGLGKTVQFIYLCNIVRPKDVLIICPAHLKRNWYREIQKWITYDTSVSIAYSYNDFPDADIVIINYDILRRNRDAIRARKWDIIGVDEAHYLKNPKAQRTKEVCGYSALQPLQADRKIAMTGTPIPNRPIEIFPVLKWLDPFVWTSYIKFAIRYCNASQGRYGWDVLGSSNLTELQDRLRSSIMIRRLKRDVLPQLPPKQWQVIELDVDAAIKKAVKLESRILEKAGIDLSKLTTFEDCTNVINKLYADSAAFNEMSRIRRELALSKIPQVIAHLEDCLAETGKVVCFCYHRDVSKAVYNHFGRLARLVIGGVSDANKDAAEQAFQNDPEVKLFVGNIEAAGTGLTLTASSLAVFAELSWVPGEVTQAEDRIHRITQTENVLIQYLVVPGSLDCAMAQTLVYKAKNQDQALNVQQDDFDKIVAF